MILQFINWNVNPEIFPNISWLPIRWYGLFFVLGFYIGLLIMQRIFKKEGFDLKLLDKLTMYMLVSTIVGARLGHCLFYEPDYYLTKEHIVEILFVWQGGLASHGAAISIVFALWLFIRKYKEFTFLWVLDRIVITVALAGFWIRMGNLMNSEIYGIETSLPWGFIFERNFEQVAKHPTQIYEALSYLIIFVVLLTYYRRKDGKPIPGYLFSAFLVLVFTARFFIEIIKENQVPFEEHIPLNMGQILSIPLILIGIATFIWARKRNKAKALQP